MTSKIMVPTEMCDDNIIRYLAMRYHCTPQDIISRFFKLEGIVNDSSSTDISFEDNEIEILRDMKICPSEIEFV